MFHNANGSSVFKQEPLANNAAAPPPYGSRDAGGATMTMQTVTTTNRKRTVTKRRRRRTVKRAGPSSAKDRVLENGVDQQEEEEQLSSELEEQSEEETITSSHEQHQAFSLQAPSTPAVNGLGILHKATVAANGAITPTILVDKPLPDFPVVGDDVEASPEAQQSRPKRRSASPPARLRNADPVDELEHETLKLNKSASVRRIKSFGDLLSSKPALEPTGGPDFHRHASQPDIDKPIRPTSVAFDLVRSEESRKAAIGLGLGQSPGKPRTVTKRASSLGFIRRGSASNILSNADEGAEDSAASAGQARVPSNATAPPGTFVKATEPDRKRKGSGFSFFSGFLKGKAKDTPVTPPVEDEVAPQTPTIASAKEAVPIPTSATTRSPIAAETTPKTTPSGYTASRRYSIFPSFFRSSSNTPTAGPDTLSPDLAPAMSRQGSASTITPPLASPSPLPAEPAQPLAMVRDSSLPQLPSIDRNLGDITFTGLFEFGPGSSSSKKGKRSRASTKSSIASFLSSSSQQQSTSRLRSGSTTSQTSASQQQDYLNCKEESAAGSGLHRDKTITRGDKVPDPAKLASTPPVSSLLTSDRAGSVRHRVQRSNSASSVVPSRIAATGFGNSSLSSRPSFNRSRSSSTVHSTVAANGSMRYQQSSTTSGIPAYSPAITITAQEGLPPAVDDFDFSFFADIAARAGPPSSSGYSSSNPPETPDMNVNDGFDEFEAALPSGTFRFSSDSRGSSSGAPSFLSTSSPSSTVGKPPSILQKTLRKRANTAGSLLSSSMPPSAAKGPGSPSSAGVSAVSVMATRSARSNSSSRLSSFLTSPTSFLSSSPTTTSLSGSVQSPSWFSTTESPTNGLHIATGEGLTDQQDMFQSPTTSQVGSPHMAGDGANPWSSTTSISTSGQVSSLQAAGRPRTGTSSPAMSSQASLSPTTRLRSGSIAAAASRRSVVSVTIEEDDTSEAYVQRLKEALSRSELATRLASSGDAFHLAALATYMQDFDFVNDPIDIALRKLLLGLSLPKETQQIDRVMEAFATRYNACNPGLFSTGDQPYILAFSMIMLHTDAFNKAAKSKMTKADYVKNTRIDGISINLLEYIYDNISYAPFVYAADEEADLFSAQRSASDVSVGSTVLGSTSSRDKSKLDIYDLILNGLVGKLRLEVHKLVPVKNPYSYTGNVAFFDCSALHHAFTYAHILEIPSPTRRPSEASSGGVNSQDGNVSMKITKVGVLERKDDLLEGGKKASSRKWKPWSVLLSGTQLLFFKDPGVAFSLQEQIFDNSGSLAAPQAESQRAYLPALPTFRPDYIISLQDSIALYDFTYAKYSNVFRLLLPNGRQMLFKAEDEKSLNSWISIINYGSSFRSTGIRMRSNQTEAPSGPRAELPKFSADSTSQLAKASTATSISAVSNGSNTSSEPVAIETERLPRDLQDYVDETFVFSQSTTSDLQSTSAARNARNASRSDIVRSKVIELEAKIKLEQADLATDLRTVRNLAILTPFTTTSRNKIEHALHPIAQRIRVTRQTIARLICYRECLCRDLLAAEREMLCEKHMQNGNSRGSQPSLLALERRRLERPGTADQSLRSVSGKSGDIARSASQDDLARLARSPSLLKRSLTSTSEQAAELGITASAFAASALHSSSAAKPTISPIMAASPFEPVKEEEPGQTELAPPVRDG